MRDTADLLKREEPELWQWCRDDSQEQALRESVEVDLLRSTIALPRDAHPRLYEAADAAAKGLGLHLPLHLYQAQRSEDWNASVALSVDAAHIVFQGDLTRHLDDRELQALLAHELGHILLWRIDDQRYLTTLRALQALSHGTDACPVYAVTLSRFQRMTEFFCDRCSLTVTNALESVVSALVKTETGVTDLNPDAYIQQALSVVDSVADPESASDGASKEKTHPETRQRVAGLSLWESDRDQCETRLLAMVRLPRTLDNLDLVDQPELAKSTRLLIDHMLAPEWMRCEATEALARQYFHDYEFPRTPVDSPLSDMMKDFGESLANWVLLDFVTADNELRESALAHALSLAETLGSDSALRESAQRELRLRKRQLQLIIERGIPTNPDTPGSTRQEKD